MDNFQTLDHLLQLTSLRGQASLQADGVRLTSNFLRCVKSEQDMDSYQKRFRWAVVLHGHTILVTNFEAEHYAQLLEPLSPLFCVAPLQRLAQPRRCLACVLEPPMAVHVLGGSIHADEALLGHLQSYLGLRPRPRVGAEAWDNDFSTGRLRRVQWRGS
mmetsp:Transcript_20766/g.42572  ORF Transcript_20766/g.42572 Transcript_20766/m.42572 type:complete len:159 (-) Transcript_20766:213-689(-)